MQKGKGDNSNQILGVGKQMANSKQLKGTESTVIWSQQERKKKHLIYFEPPRTLRNWWHQVSETQSGSEAREENCVSLSEKQLSCLSNSYTVWLSDSFLNSVTLLSPTQEEFVC